MQTLRVNETANVYDLGEFLQAERDGIFEVITPRGDVFEAIARGGQSIVLNKKQQRGQGYRQEGQQHQQGQQGQQAPWQVRKISELPALT